MNLHNLHTRLARLAGRVPATPEGPTVPIIPLPDHGPPPRGTRYMTSEEVLRDVQRMLCGEWSPPVLTPAQRAEIDARFDATTGGIEVIERQARELLAREGKNNGHRPSNAH